jgi:uncharacterized membrane protein
MIPCTMSVDLAVAVFPHTEGAERAYAQVSTTHAETPWAKEIAFVEHHRHDRVVVRGTFAGRYVDEQDETDLINPLTAGGAATGAVVGAIFGPLGLAIGVVGGGIAGGEAGVTVPQLHDAFFDEVRADVPEGSSAVILLAAPEHVDAMVAAFEGHGAQVTRRSLTPEAARALQTAVAGRPPAAI